MCKVEKASPRVAKTKRDKKQKKTHQCRECGHLAVSPSALVIHVRTHTGEKPYSCNIGECKWRFSQKDSLRKHQMTIHSVMEPAFECEECGQVAVSSSALEKHMRTHTGEKPFACNIGECAWRFSIKRALKLHKMTHLGIKPNMKHTCEECGKMVESPSKLVKHMRTHTGENPYACDFGECEKRFAQQGGLNRHKRTHLADEEKRYTCSQCDYKSDRKDSMDNHERTHSDELVLSCDVCDYTCNASSNLVLHRKTHSGERKPICGFGGWCEYSTYYSSNLKTHKKTHTIEGQIRRKKQEHRLNTILKEWGHTVDPELIINAKMSNCLMDTERYFSKIDFVVINCVNAILIIECDEQQHSTYNLSCEFSRMADVQASLVKAGFTSPLYWIRYSPTSKYHIGGQQVKMHRPKREAALKKHLAKLCSPDFEPKHQMSIHYLFYDLGSEEAGPSIMADSDFPAVVKPYVSWCP